jgi:ketosteroid isomerase-like protein
MRTNTIVLALVLSLPSQAFSQTPSDTLRSLDSAWARSYATNDTVLAGKLFDDSLVVTGGNGRLKNKKGEMADVGPTPGGQIHYFRTRDVVVKAYGGAGFVIGLAEWRYTFNGQTSDYRRRYTAVYARGGPLGWRMVALHIGPAPATQ